jgi:iron complex transport system permease protein
MNHPAAKPKPAAARIRAAAVLLGLSGLGLLLSVLTGPTAGLAGSGLVDEGLALAHHEPGVWQIVWDIRLPRGSGAWLAGALLGLSGALAQTVFRNPLADPYLLGSASGAALGVAGWLVGATALGAAGLGWHMSWPLTWQLGTTGAAFIGALAAVLLTVALARGVQQTLRLLLAGVVVGVVLGALSSLLVLLQPEALLRMQSFVWGSTAYLNAADNGLLALVLLICLTLACVLGRPLDALHLGETTARSLGVPVSGVRAVCLVLISLATATSVAHTGLIAFVGLAAPHMVKRWLPMASGNWMVLAAGMGGVLLLLADVLARGLLAPLELPVGVMTAVLGGCYLLWLMRRPS